GRRCRRRMRAIWYVVASLPSPQPSPARGRGGMWLLLCVLRSLGAQSFFLLAQLGRELRAEVLGFEHRPDLDFVVVERRALQPFDRFVQRLDLPHPETGDELLRF